MALKIRLRQQGSRNQKAYRIVVTDARERRDGKYIEKLGHYLPHMTSDTCVLDGDRMFFWLQKGAQMSEQVKALAASTAPEALKQFREYKQAILAKKIEKKRAAKKKQAVK